MKHHINVESKREIFSFLSSIRFWCIGFQILYAQPFVHKHVCTHIYAHTYMHIHTNTDNFTLHACYTHLPHATLTGVRTYMYAHTLGFKNREMQLLVYLLLKQ